MKALFLLMTLVMALTCIASASEALPGPGAPCVNTQISCAPSIVPTFTSQIADPSFTFTLADPSVTNLGIFVVPGTVVLCETPGCTPSSNSTEWSDVIQFSDDPNGAGSIATVYFDLDDGKGVSLPAGFSPSFNAVAIDESATDSQTVYVAGVPGVNSATYNVLSDPTFNGNEPPEPTETPEPTTVTLLGSGLAALLRIARKK